MATAKKTDEIVCSLLSWGLMGEDALGSHSLAPSWGENKSSHLEKNVHGLKEVMPSELLLTRCTQHHVRVCSWFGFN